MERSARFWGIGRNPRIAPNHYETHYFFNPRRAPRRPRAPPGRRRVEKVVCFVTLWSDPRIPSDSPESRGTLQSVTKHTTFVNPPPARRSPRPPGSPPRVEIDIPFIYAAGAPNQFVQLTWQARAPNQLISIFWGGRGSQSIGQPGLPFNRGRTPIQSGLNSRSVGAGLPFSRGRTPILK